MHHDLVLVVDHFSLSTEYQDLGEPRLNPHLHVSSKPGMYRMAISDMRKTFRCLWKGHTVQHPLSYGDGGRNSQCGFPSQVSSVTSHGHSEDSPWSCEGGLLQCRAAASPPQRSFCHFPPLLPAVLGVTLRSVISRKMRCRLCRLVGV